MKKFNRTFLICEYLLISHISFLKESIIHLTLKVFNYVYCLCVYVKMWKNQNNFSLYLYILTTIFLFDLDWRCSVNWCASKPKRKKEKSTRKLIERNNIFSSLVQKCIFITDTLIYTYPNAMTGSPRAFVLARSFRLRINKSTSGERHWSLSKYVIRCPQKFDSREWYHEIWREFYWTR